MVERARKLRPSRMLTNELDSVPLQNVRQVRMVPQQARSGGFEFGVAAIEDSTDILFRQPGQIDQAVHIGVRLMDRLCNGE